MQLELAAKRLAELGHATRLEIFRLLVKGGHQGLPVGDIQTALNVPGSTLSHHLTRLVTVGLVVQRREGRTLYCVPQYPALDELIDFLQDECCANECAREARQTVD
ncbi:ArsR/SmtB family transcription factor [Simiduia agarivorans]|uniref:ArsR family transcriptional regulator n=1 Tax=Simiduia agarivorans (strain DSM 21679 / JCM 13881 / BCRC 17597 / SA1) TaxID=1117647 RepID=K4KH44_SIMAS|nr:metalloregulator ArsR/SmtB family transcription factor [Simiduia agarivorans]AFU97258.1 ArsR family transcriptional regulator [Simiduia agarivorans SA1 = DSM 21679]